MRVVGDLRVSEVIEDALAPLWLRTGALSGIDRATFLGYFGSRPTGFAIGLEAVRRYCLPKTLQEVAGTIRPPQSFQYLTTTERSAPEAPVD